jgi:mono/diheme cytochrome c family protein
MMKTIRSQVVLAVVVSLASAVGFAQAAGEATYKAKCQACHGATGTPSAGMVKAMAVKPVSDPEVKKLTVDEMIAITKTGKGKMKPVTGLTDAQLKDVVGYYRSLGK